MTVKNTSNKIISIGPNALLPDQTMNLSDAVASAPSIKAMIAKNQLAAVPADMGSAKKAGKSQKAVSADSGAKSDTSKGPVSVALSADSAAIAT